MKYVIALVVFASLAIYFFYKDRREQKKIEGLFSGREALSNKEFYDKYFSSNNIPEHIVYGVKRILEEQLDTDLSKLQAEDSFSSNLSAYFALDSMADVEIVVALEEEFNITISDKEAQETHSIRDIVNLVQRKTNEKA